MEYQLEAVCQQALQHWFQRFQSRAGWDSAEHIEAIHLQPTGSNEGPGPYHRVECLPADLHIRHFKFRRGVGLLSRPSAAGHSGYTYAGTREHSDLRNGNIEDVNLTPKGRGMLREIAFS